MIEVYADKCAMVPRSMQSHHPQMSNHNLFLRVDVVQQFVPRIHAFPKIPKSFMLQQLAVSKHQSIEIERILLKLMTK